MSTLEWVAAIAGAISVYLSARENIWSWPTAIVNVALYIDRLLRRAACTPTWDCRSCISALSIYGWYEWLYGGKNRTELRVSRAAARDWLDRAPRRRGLLARPRHAHGDACRRRAPVPRRGLTTLSLVAQWMMTRKLLENWVLWIVADIVYVADVRLQGAAGDRGALRDLSRAGRARSAVVVASYQTKPLDEPAAA